MKSKRTMRERAAFHEAGHAVASRLMGRAVKSIEIDSPIDGFLGMVLHYKRLSESRAINSGNPDLLLQQAIPLMMILAGGPAAEKIFNNNRYNSVGATSDDRELLDLALKVSRDDNDEAIALIKWIKMRIERLLRQPLYWSVVTCIAEELLKSTKLTGKQIEIVLRKDFEAGNFSRTERSKLNTKVPVSPGRLKPAPS